MIGRIRGILIEKQAPYLLVDVQGVGYEVQASLTTFFELPNIDETVSLHTHFIVREDVQQLYGFSSQRERQLFRELIKVSGVGPKMALAILSGMSSGDFARCVRTNDIASLMRLPGVGKKTAERLLVEMRDRLKDWGEGLADERGQVGVTRGGAAQEAESALLSLGYKEAEASRMVAAARVENEEASSAELIRAALRKMVK